MLSTIGQVNTPDCRHRYEPRVLGFTTIMSTSRSAYSTVELPHLTSTKAGLVGAGPIFGQSNCVLPRPGSTGMSDDLTMQRLDNQIEWYDQRSGRSQKLFKLLKIVVITAAALIPFLAGMAIVPAWI